MTEAPNRDKPRLPGWAKLLLGIAVLLLLLLGIVKILGHAATRRWHEYADELRAAGQPVTFEDIEALREPSPEGPTAARLLEGFPSQLDDIEPPDSSYVLILGAGESKGDAFSGYPRYAIEASRRFLENRLRR